MAILQNPDVMDAHDHRFTRGDVQEWLDRQKERYQKDGFGLWAVGLKSTGKMIGQAGLIMQPYRGTWVLEIGYGFNDRYWRGYAREAAAGCKKDAFDVLKSDKAYSIIKFDNTASIKVAEGTGMKKVDAFITRYYSGKTLHDLDYSKKKKEGEWKHPSKAIPVQRTAMSHSYMERLTRSSGSSGADRASCGAIK